jgi:hypothetical protein
MPSSTFFRPLAALLLLAAATFGQSQNASVGGRVTDASGAAVPNGTATLSQTERALKTTVKTDNEGRFSFPNVNPGTYDLSVTATGFNEYVQRSIQLLASQPFSTDVVLKVGDVGTKVEVNADATQLNVENGVVSEGIAPTVINELPLLVAAGTPRNAVQFISFLPGVNTGTSPQAFNSRINGGLKMGDEALMDGVSMQEGTMSQGGMVSFFDFPTTPDMVSEVKILTSSYEPEYGVTTGGVIMVTTRSGTDQIHGAGFEYFRNRDLNALQFTNNRGPGDQRPKDNENEYGFAIGGPVKLPFIPLVWGSRHRTYFFHDEEYLRSLGSASRAHLSIPTAQERTGDFSDYPLPLYDPSTTVITNGVVSSRKVFPGNQIPVSQQSPLALKWMSFLPATTSPGVQNNFLAPPVSDGILSDVNHFLFKIDHNWGDKDHIFATIWRQITIPSNQCQLPLQLCTSNPAIPEDAWVNRMNWDHIFTPALMAHTAYGYLNRNEGYGSIPGQSATAIEIPNAVAYHASPAASFSGSNITNMPSWGQNAGPGPLNKSTRPSHLVNELVSWVHGAHTFRFGGEYRHLAQVFRSAGGESGSVGFSEATTGLTGVPSGNAYASMLVGAVDNGSLNVNNVWKYGAVQKAFSLNAGDTWKVNNKLTVNYGLRWDRFDPTFETSDELSFLGFAPNPGAGNLPGSVMYAGTKWGAASFGKRYPEDNFNGGFGPRLGAAYRIDNQTVVRLGYGVFYTQAFYPGWGGGMSLDGFNPSTSFGSSYSGQVPAFNLDNGFPAYSTAPDISLTADNGKNGPNYRPTYGNHLSYTQQWNLSVERKIGASSLVSVAWVGNKGTHLPSTLQPLNYLNPSLLTSMGSTELNSVFQPGQTSLYGVSAPYSNWVTDLNAAGTCKPTVAQALVAFPQYCGSLNGQNENQGTSMYQSFQMKLEKGFKNGFYAGLNYTYSHFTTDAAGSTQSGSAGYGGIGNVISQYQGSRNKALSTDDIPNSVSVLGTYDLPFGAGQKWLTHSGVSNKVFGGWTLATSMKFTNGMPLYFRNSAVCGVPGQIEAACIPGITGNALAQDWGSVDVNKPLYNASAFEPASKFAAGNYLGTGPRVSDVRGSGYKDVNLSIAKKIDFYEKVHMEIRAEMFNILNNHYFVCDGQAWGDCNPANSDPSSPSFGVWNGTVSAPRNIQLVGRITF